MRGCGDVCGFGDAEVDSTPAVRQAASKATDDTNFDTNLRRTRIDSLPQGTGWSTHNSSLIKYCRAACPHVSPETYKALNVIGHYAPELERKIHYKRPRAE